MPATTAEHRRLAEDAKRTKNWKRWGPYLAERQWGTVREDYSADGSSWDYLPHDHARSRAYRWGEDGFLGITDRECRMCFAVALWNGRDPILKERLFGLTGPQGNHGEDVKELYYYLDSTPTHSYMKALYKYPHAEYPYAQLANENARRGKGDAEFEILDTGVFEDDRYFDIFAEYAKGGPNDVLIRITIVNRGDEVAPLHVLPTVWFRNTWTWGCEHEGCWIKPHMQLKGKGLFADHVSLGKFQIDYLNEPDQWMFTENETNTRRLYDADTWTPYVKDAFGRYLIDGEEDAVNPKQVGTKAAGLYRLQLEPGGETQIKLRLYPAKTRSKPAFDRVFKDRIAEADEFYGKAIDSKLDDEGRKVARQAYAGLLWTKQFYHYSVRDWLNGDLNMPPPPEERKQGRNADWKLLFNRDVLSMPDKWEYPWPAAWDTAFHMIPFAKIDPRYAKEQLVLFLREWYMHPNGQIPAYEFALGDVNPPVHAWACWRVYKMTGQRGKRDRDFLARCFQKLLLNFTWWINRKDVHDRNIFAGGFLGLDNIGVFDRSRPLPTGGYLDQADGTAWMAFYCSTMLSIALELARDGDPAYEDMASKFFEHFIAIADATNMLGGTGLWDEQDGFYYDKLVTDGHVQPLRVRSLVGLIPLIAVEVLEERTISKLKGFRKRMQWFLDNRADLARHISYLECDHRGEADEHYLLAIPSRQRLERTLRYMLDESEFLSPFGIRSLSRYHAEHPFLMTVNGEQYRVAYTPAESDSTMFGGNSNWRGPVWFPINFLLIEALERYHGFYGDDLKLEFPTGSGKRMNLSQIADALSQRLTRLFLPNRDGQRPAHGDDTRYADDPNFRDLVLFYEYFHGDTGRGVGASHQTGWTALVARCLEKCAS
jgi:hypothetical protein